MSFYIDWLYGIEVPTSNKLARQAVMWGDMPNYHSMNSHDPAFARRRAAVQAKWDARKERRALAAHVDSAPAATGKGGRL